MQHFTFYIQGFDMKMGMPTCNLKKLQILVNLAN